MRHACIDCIHLRGYSANPHFIRCDNCGLVRNEFLGRLEKGLPDCEPEEHVCPQYQPNYGPPALRDLLMPLVQRGDTLGNVLRTYYASVPNPYFIRQQGPMVKVFDNADGIPTNLILCALSDWIVRRPPSSGNKPIIWLTLRSIEHSTMIAESGFYYVRTPHTVERGVLNCLLATFFLRMPELPRGSFREHLERVLRGDDEYI